jgi:hypothetical protein
LRVIYWNAEDPDDEIERRIAAVCLRYGLDPSRLEGQLFLGSRITGAGASPCSKTATSSLIKSFSLR